MTAIALRRIHSTFEKLTTGSEAYDEAYEGSTIPVKSIWSMKEKVLAYCMINISIEYDCWNTGKCIVGWQSIVLMLAWITVAGYYLHTKLAILHIT